MHSQLFPLPEQRGCLFEYLVLAQLARERIRRVFFLALLRLSLFGQEHTRFGENELGRDNQVIGERVELDVAGARDKFEVLVSHCGQRDAANVHLALFDQLQQQVERPFKIRQTNRINVHSAGIIARIWIMSEPIIKFDNVSRVYTMGARTLSALAEVSLEIFPGEFVAVAGASGSGKSTLLNLAGGIDRPTRGAVWVAGRRIDGMDENSLAKWRRANVGIVFQFFQLLPTLTALENVTLPLELAGAAQGGYRQAAEQALARVGLAARANQLPSELSGGEQQRVAIARALINDPPILLADEPTGNLDSVTAEGIIDYMAELAASGKTILLVTHEGRLARAAHRIVMMRDGQIVHDA